MNDIEIFETRKIWSKIPGKF